MRESARSSVPAVFAGNNASKLGIVPFGSAWSDYNALFGIVLFGLPFATALKP
jgi:hypothetical protein